MFALVILAAAQLVLPPAAHAQVCERNISADVVALDQVIQLNRRGACMPHGQIFALAQDVVDTNGLGTSCADGHCTAGNVTLRPGKRPRPMVLRMNVNDCLTVNFTNLITPDRANVANCPDCIKFLNGKPAPQKTDAFEQPATRDAGVHVIGMQLVGDISSDGSFVGRNASSLVPPGGSARYTFFAEREGQHLLYSTAANTGGEGDGGQLPVGLFGAVNVEPRGSTWYRSQVTAEEIKASLNTTSANSCAGTPGYTCPLPGEVAGHPILLYGKTIGGRPVFKMLDATNKIVHSDLTAIIAGSFLDGYPLNKYTYPARTQPFREFTLIYHDEMGAVQAFPQFSDPKLFHTLHSVRDAFGINYGTGGIGSEIIANRLKVGPEADCTGCKYEEFFLTSWVLGDPAMNVDVPANACIDPVTGLAIPGCGAKQAFFPDDPSNVYHSYLRDHTKMRILHAGPKEHHIHHLHAHQWLYAPDSDTSSYLDSQAFGPGAGFTLEMVYNGSGNRNQTVGDSIFHCHFYPHFAMGMWAMWRVHDVFEDGTRRLPDYEIADGTPSPALVPLPGRPMAPMPGAKVQIAGSKVMLDGVWAHNYAGTGNPGYPYFIPGIAGARPPHPPLDTVDDGGLPRHVLQPGGKTFEVQTRFDFTKEILAADAVPVAETGSGVEIAAMKYHGTSRTLPTVKTNGAPGSFVVNGLPPAPGAPYAEPCMTDDGAPTGSPRIYKAANIQLDVVFNKKGWHFPQQRLITLWEDVDPTHKGLRPPEPFFFRANSKDCITYHHTNLVPNIYELDDFQVRTPTDILGQHIHLVKFDVTSSDGSANGWNYEDGTFSPDEVIERIHAINNGGGFGPPGGLKIHLTPEKHPFFGAGPVTPRSPLGAYVGAQTTVQKWYADPVWNNDKVDRTLRTVFTHDHYGPSTHQQAGLYAGLLVEPEDARWRDPVTGTIMGGPGIMLREDGGPTSWRVDVLTGVGDADSYREFMLEYADFQLAYETGSQPGLEEGTGPTFPNIWACHDNLDPTCLGQQPGNGSGFGVHGLGFDNRKLSINPPGKDEDFADLLVKAPFCPVPENNLGPVLLLKPPCPEAISADDPGTFVVNYRNDPVALRVRDLLNNQAAGDAGDLALAFHSKVTRADPVLNTTPINWPYEPTIFPSPVDGALAGDPFTPLLRGYEHDKVQIRTLVGAHEEGHNMSINGMKWLFEPSWKNSGFRNSQMAGISEHFEFLIPQLTKNPITTKGFLDYLYGSGSATDDLWNGNWGLFRVYRGSQTPIQRLPNNPNGGRELAAGEESKVKGVCPTGATDKYFTVVATTAQQLLGGALPYNNRPALFGPIEDPTAIIYVRNSDLTSTGTLKPGLEVEPLVLRANAGDCINITLVNNLKYASENLRDQPGWNTLPMIVEFFNNNDIRPSTQVGLHPQLVHYDVSRSDGNNIGFNPIQTAAATGSVSYQWYAGDVFVDDFGMVQSTPVEYGATNLIPADRVKQPSKGAIGALIIEPAGATWVEDDQLTYCGRVNQPRCSHASATVSHGFGDSFREFVLLFQDDLNLRCAGCGKVDDINAVSNTAEAEDPEDSGQKAFNYRTEPMWFRKGFLPHTPLQKTKEEIFTAAVSNTEVGADPETPIFWAKPGAKVRFRVLEPGGHGRNHVFQAHGHVWQQEPWVSVASFPRGPVAIGDNPLSMWEGSRMGHGPTNHFDAVFQHGAGGAFAVPGDYLFRDQSSFQFDGGLWGLLRVDFYNESVGGTIDPCTTALGGSLDKAVAPTECPTPTQQ